MHTMSATPSDSVWTYTWTVSSTVTSSTATVSGTDLAGNAYSGTDSITFIIDNTAPTVSLTDTDSDNLVSNSDVVTITATFSESMSATPTLILIGDHFRCTYDCNQLRIQFGPILGLYLDQLLHLPL